MSQPALTVFVVYPGIKLLDLSGPLQVFTDARRPSGGTEAYDAVVASLAGGPVPTDTGIDVSSVRLDSLGDKRIDSLLICGGNGARNASQDSQLTTAVNRIAVAARRVGSICTGAFVLAGAGLLDGRRAVTHWESCDALANAYPAIHVEPDSIYVRDGAIWTSAGVTAGIDMALAMVAQDMGRGPALDLARSLVAYLVRPGGQSQFSSVLDRQCSDSDGQFDALHNWIRENLQAPLNVDALATRMNMSQRTFARRYVEATGQTPARAVEALRIEGARQLLETCQSPLSRIARECGFSDDEHLRRAFARVLGVAPTDYRARFH